MQKKAPQEYNKKEAQGRFLAALRGAFGKTQPKVKKKSLDESRKRDSKKKGSR